MEYWLITTDDKNQGGGIMKRNGPTAPMGSSPNAFVCTVAVESVDAAVEAAEKAGATVAMPKGPIMGMGWGAYLIDTEGNLFGVFTMDTNAA
ncbi:MAG TPA: hypothetical protein VER79_14690 [Candidatus Limnocylindrales bacterium]|nr:hypothetical protein [Candidatus Limnocylindrales bacterium]